MEMTWVEDIRTWNSPNPNDDGISLLFSVFKDLKIKFNSVGAELGMEMSLRMPWIEFNKLLEKQKQTFLDATQAIWEIRTVKTKAEINHINFICKAVSSCYYSLPKIINLGETERQVSEKLKKLSKELMVQDQVIFLNNINYFGISLFIKKNIISTKKI